MPLTIRRRVLGGLLVLSSALSGVALLAAPATAASQGQPVQLSLRPVGQTGSFFDLTMAPGQRGQFRVELGNHGSAPIMTSTYAADAYSIINGGFGAKDRASAPTATTAWLSYTPAVLKLSAGQASVRAFTVTVPKSAQPGQYLSSLILENDVPVKGTGSVRLNQVIRQAVAVSIRVPGTLHPAFRFGAASQKVTARHSVIDVQIANTGNADLKPVGTVKVRSETGTVISSAPVVMRSLYAHNSTLVQTTLAGTLDPGRYLLDVTLTDPATKVTNAASGVPFTVRADAPTKSAGVQPGPLPQILRDAGGGPSPYLIGVIALVVVAALILMRRRRRRTPARRH